MTFLPQNQANLGIFGLAARLVRSVGITACAVSALMVSTAHGADMLADDTVATTPVEYGTGWYLRGEIGMNFNNTKRESDVSYPAGGIQNIQTTDDDEAWNYGIAIGHNFTSNLRGDISLEHVSKGQYNEFGTTTNLRSPCAPAWLYLPDGSAIDHQITNCVEENTASHNIVGSMATAYYDFDTSLLGFRPFVGAGIGVFRNTYTSTIGDITCQPNASEECRPTDGGVAAQAERYTQTGTRNSGTSYHLAGSLTAGLSYSLTDNLSLDTSYRFSKMLNEPLFGGNRAEASSRVPDTFHAVKLGLRYEIW